MSTSNRRKRRRTAVPGRCVVGFLNLRAENIVAGGDDHYFYLVIRLGGRSVTTPFSSVPLVSAVSSSVSPPVAVDSASPSSSLPPNAALLANVQGGKEARSSDNVHTSGSLSASTAFGNSYPNPSWEHIDDIVFYWSDHTGAMPDAEFTLRGRPKAVVDAQRKALVAKTQTIMQLLESSSSSSSSNSSCTSGGHADAKTKQQQQQSTNGACTAGDTARDPLAFQPVEPLPTDLFLGYARVRLDPSMLSTFTAASVSASTASSSKHHQQQNGITCVRLGIRSASDTPLLRLYGTLGSIEFRLESRAGDTLPETHYASDDEDSDGTDYSNRHHERTLLGRSAAPVSPSGAVATLVGGSSGEARGVRTSAGASAAVAGGDDDGDDDAVAFGCQAPLTTSPYLRSAVPRALTVFLQKEKRELTEAQRAIESYAALLEARGDDGNVIITDNNEEEKDSGDVGSLSAAGAVSSSSVVITGVSLHLLDPVFLPSAVHTYRLAQLVRRQRKLQLRRERLERLEGMDSASQAEWWSQKRKKERKKRDKEARRAQRKASRRHKTSLSSMSQSNSLVKFVGGANRTTFWDGVGNEDDDDDGTEMEALLNGLGVLGRYLTVDNTALTLTLRTVVSAERGGRSSQSVRRTPKQRHIEWRLPFPVKCPASKGVDPQHGKEFRDRQQLKRQFMQSVLESPAIGRNTTITAAALDMCNNTLEGFDWGGLSLPTSLEGLCTLSATIAFAATREADVVSSPSPRCSGLYAGTPLELLCVAQGPVRIVLLDEGLNSSSGRRFATAVVPCFCLPQHGEDSDSGSGGFAKHQQHPLSSQQHDRNAGGNVTEAASSLLLLHQSDHTPHHHDLPTRPTSPLEMELEADATHATTALPPVSSTGIASTAAERGPRVRPCGWLTLTLELADTFDTKAYASMATFSSLTPCAVGMLPDPFSIPTSGATAVQGYTLPVVLSDSSPLMSRQGTTTMPTTDQNAISSMISDTTATAVVPEALGQLQQRRQLRRLPTPLIIRVPSTALGFTGPSDTESVSAVKLSRLLADSAASVVLHPLKGHFLLPTAAASATIGSTTTKVGKDGTTAKMQGEASAEAKKEEEELSSAPTGGLILRISKVSLPLIPTRSKEKERGSGIVIVARIDPGPSTLAANPTSDSGATPGRLVELFRTITTPLPLKASETTMQCQVPSCTYVLESSGGSQGPIKLDVLRVSPSPSAEVYTGDDASTAADFSMSVTSCVGFCEFDFARLSFVGKEQELPLMTGRRPLLDSPITNTAAAAASSGSLTVSWNISPEIQQSVVLQQLFLQQQQKQEGKEKQSQRRVRISSTTPLLSSPSNSENMAASEVELAMTSSIRSLPLPLSSHSLFPHQQQQQQQRQVPVAFLIPLPPPPKPLLTTQSSAAAPAQQRCATGMPCTSTEQDQQRGSANMESHQDSMMKDSLTATSPLPHRGRPRKHRMPRRIFSSLYNSDGDGGDGGVSGVLRVTLLSIANLRNPPLSSSSLHVLSGGGSGDSKISSPATMPSVIAPYAVIHYCAHRSSSSSSGALDAHFTQSNYSLRMPLMSVQGTLSTTSSFLAAAAAAADVVTWNYTVEFPISRAASVQPLQEIVIEVRDANTRGLFGVATVLVHTPSYLTKGETEEEELGGEAMTKTETHVVSAYRPGGLAAQSSRGDARAPQLARDALDVSRRKAGRRGRERRETTQWMSGEVHEDLLLDTIRPAVAQLTVLTTISHHRSLIEELDLGSQAVALELCVLGGESLPLNNNNNNTSPGMYVVVSVDAAVSPQPLPSCRSQEKPSSSVSSQRYRREYRSATVVSHSGCLLWYLELPLLLCMSPEDTYTLAVYAADADGFDTCVGEACVTALRLLEGWRNTTSAFPLHSYNGAIFDAGGGRAAALNLQGLCLRVPLTSRTASLSSPPFVTGSSGVLLLEWRVRLPRPSLSGLLPASVDRGERRRGGGAMCQAPPAYRESSYVLEVTFDVAEGLAVAFNRSKTSNERHCTHSSPNARRRGDLHSQRGHSAEAPYPKSGTTSRVLVAVLCVDADNSKGLLFGSPRGEDSSAALNTFPSVHGSDKDFGSGIIYAVAPLLPSSLSNPHGASVQVGSQQLLSSRGACRDGYRANFHEDDRGGSAGGSTRLPRYHTLCLPSRTETVWLEVWAVAGAAAAAGEEATLAALVSSSSR